MEKTIDTSVESLILQELQNLNVVMVENNLFLKQMDWKMWIIMNTIVEDYLNSGRIAVDPRSS